MTKREYIDFKLYLTAAPGSACQVALLPTPEVGETVTPVTVPAESAPTAGTLAYLESKSLTLSNLARLGRQLADCLLPRGTIRDLFRQAYNQAGPAGAGVRLRLVIADHALKQWPWEFVYFQPDEPDPMEGFLALDPRISIVRHEPLPRPHPTVGNALGELTDVRMLVASASPDASGFRLLSLDVDEEVDTVTRAVQGFDLEGVRISARPLKNVNREQLRHALLAKPHIFHFAGHGYVDLAREELRPGPAREQVYLLLSEPGAPRRADLVTGAELKGWLQAAGVRLVILGACRSGTRSARHPWDGMAGALLGGEIPAVITMQQDVVDTHAIAFSRAFYSALGLGLSLDEAMWSGRTAMREVTSGDREPVVNVEWGVPVLYTRLADGALFPERIGRAAEPAEAFRRVFRQTASGIMAGQMTGVRVELIKNGVRVVQQVKEVAGELTGIQVGAAAAGANIEVVQELGRVRKGGSVTAATLDEL